MGSTAYPGATSRPTERWQDEQQLAAVVGYCFAWYTFNPATEVFRAGEASKPR